MGSGVVLVSINSCSSISGPRNCISLVREMIELVHDEVESTIKHGRIVLSHI